MTRKTNRDEEPGPSSDVTAEKTTEKPHPGHSNNELFECNICLEQLVEPVVTLCGHLYCWVCLYRWLQHQSTCPVCKASVAKENVIPVYGRCGDNVDPRTRTDIPSRPLGQRPDPLERQPMNFTFAYPNRDRNGGGFFTSLYELPSRMMQGNVPPHPAGNERNLDMEAQQRLLSRILLILGSLVIVCLLTSME